ncbi:MAG TPA: hypothetical protein EYM44_03020 [Gammaproteobacteria bacterium]|nr:hypothetical protein [Gammaproteobacteria bacterium]
MSSWSLSSAVNSTVTRFNGGLFSVISTIPSSIISERIRLICDAPVNDSICCDTSSRSGIKDLRFHDLRHETTSRPFEKGLNPVEVATITGPKDPRMLMRYTHLRAEDLAQKLG